MARYEHGVKEHSKDHTTTWFKIIFDNFPNNYYLLYIDKHKDTKDEMLKVNEDMKDMTLHFVPSVIAELVAPDSIGVDKLAIDILVYKKLNLYGKIQAVQVVLEPIPETEADVKAVEKRFDLKFGSDGYWGDKKLQRKPTTYNPQIEAVPLKTVQPSLICCSIS